MKKTPTIKSIEEFLAEHHSDEDLTDFILGEVKDEEWRDEYIFCKTEEERLFWQKNIGEYSYLYVYSNMITWKEDFVSKDIEDRCDSYTKNLQKEIDEDMMKFCRDAQNIPICILLKIGFHVDSYFWEKDRFIPCLSMRMEMLKDKDRASVLYEKYYRLLSKNIEDPKEKGLMTEHLDSYLKFCGIVDTAAQKNDCFVLLIKSLSKPEEPTNLNQMLGEFFRSNRLLTTCGITYNTMIAIFEFCTKYANSYALEKGTLRIFHNQLWAMKIEEYVHQDYFVKKENFTMGKSGENSFFEKYYPEFTKSEDLRIILEKKMRPWSFVFYCHEFSDRVINKIVDEFLVEFEKGKNIIEDVFSQARIITMLSNR